MNEIKFSIEPSRFRERALLLTYCPTATPNSYELTQVQWAEQCPAKFKQLWLKETPVVITYQALCPVKEFQHWLQVGCEIKEISQIDTSFANFWDTYAYKVGNKARVQKKWNLLPEKERILAIGAIARYRRFAEGKRIERVYPETYIDQRRWENEF